MEIYEAINCSKRAFFMRMIFPLICKCGNENCKLFNEEPDSNRRCKAWPKDIIIRANNYDVDVFHKSHNMLEVIYGMYYDSVDWANPTIHEEISQKFLSIITQQKLNG